MTEIVRRTCRTIFKDDPCGQPIEAWEDVGAYVLLGPSGAGKTTVFTHEALRTGGACVSARDFLTFDDRPEWHGKTLFIDGFDEMRTGAVDGRTSLDRIRAKLHQMGHPRFRLSCRDADWFGASDRLHLKKVSPDDKIRVLRLEPLSDEGVHQMLSASSGIDDPENFIEVAESRGLRELLDNPQNLKMLVDAVGSNGDWPDTRMQAFDMACRALLKEHNQEHCIANPDSASIPDLIEASGKLCAILLLTGAAGYTLPGTESNRDFPGLNQLPGSDQGIFLRCLRSKLFEAPTPGRMVPVHRLVAEFLAARYLAVLVDSGLPVGRILALITRGDGMVVTGLRGLSAWLAAHSKSSRSEVIKRDPLGTVLYGDTHGFSASEKRHLLDSLRQEASANRRLIVALQSDARLGDLVSSDMEEHYRDLLTNPSREDSWQYFIVVLVEALQYGERLPGLAGPLMKLLRDGTWWPRIRLRAIRPFLRHHGDDALALVAIKALIADVKAGKVPDSDDDLLGSLQSTF